MDEGDVVQFCPACKHLLLRDEAVMVPSSTAFVLGVGHTLIRTPGLVVVVGNLLSSFLLSTVVGRNHPINFNVIAYFDGYDHSEPACAQPGVRFLPVSPRLRVEQVVKPAHLAGSDGETGELAAPHDPLDQPEQTSVGLFPDLVGGSPEDDDGVSDCAVEELGHFPGHPEDAGVGYDPQAGVVPYVGLEPQSRGVVHADHALRAVDLCASSCAQNVAGAGHQRTVVAAQRHILVAMNGQVTTFPRPFLQVCGPWCVFYGHVEVGIDVLDDVVGATEDEEGHEDEGGCQDHHPVALPALSLFTEFAPHVVLSDRVPTPSLCLWVVISDRTSRQQHGPSLGHSHAAIIHHQALSYAN